MSSTEVFGRVYSLRATNWALAVTLHSAFLPKALVPHVESAPLWWSALTRKISDNVRFDGSGAVLQGHDTGYLIPHLSAPNWMLAVHMATSKCAVRFGKATVLVNRRPAGWWQVYAGFQVCMEPAALPIGFNVNYGYTTVTFGFSQGDLIRGLLRVAADIGLGRLASKLFKWGASLVPIQRLTDRLGAKLSPLLSRSLVDKWWVLFRDARAAQAAARLEGNYGARFTKALADALGAHFLKWGLYPLTEGKLGRGKLSVDCAPLNKGRDTVDVTSAVFAPIPILNPEPSK